VLKREATIRRNGFPKGMRVRVDFHGEMLLATIHSSTATGSAFVYTIRYDKRKKDGTACIETGVG